MSARLLNHPAAATLVAAELHRFARASLLPADADFSEHTPLAEAGIDSFNLVELLLFSERTFGVAVPESHLTRENLASLESLARCITGLAGEASTPSAR